MNIVVLLSCMYEKDMSIIHRSNVQTDVVVINQCDNNSVENFSFVNKKGRECSACFVNTTERGLSKSRNLAIKHARPGDICLLCDDDESLDDNYEDNILEAYKIIPNADVVTFKVVRNDKTMHFYDKIRKMSIKDIFRTSSIQVTFKRNSILEKNIEFDVKMGSGSGNGSGEENKFMICCKRKGLNLFFYPKNVATLLSAESLWFDGYTEKYFRDQSWVARRLLGPIWGYIYLWYHLFTHIKLYKNSLSYCKIIYFMHIGFFEKR